MIPPIPPSTIAMLRRRPQPPIPAALIGNLTARQNVWHMDGDQLWYWAPAANICGKGPDDWICLNA